MSVKGWNSKLLIVAEHDSKGGRRVRLPSSAPCEPFEVNNFKGFSSPFPQTRCLHPWYLPFCTSGSSSDFPFLWFPTSPSLSLSFSLFCISPGVRFPRISHMWLGSITRVVRFSRKGHLRHRNDAQCAQFSRIGLSRDSDLRQRV